jgi:3',5'-cyclic AMP phosphodiesterase CpdA
LSVLLQVSDTHFGTEQPPVVEALLDLARQIAPQVVVLSGDITQRARRAQFAAARSFVDRLATTKVLAIPGNHDIPLFNLFARVFHPYANYERAFGSVLDSHWSSASMLVICVNTTRPSRHKDGEISAGQIAHVSQHLRAATPQQLRIVVTHQPVHVIQERDVENLLHGHQAAVRAWSRAGADIIMGGHIHLPYVRQLADADRTLARRVWAVQAGTAVSWRVRSRFPNSVNVLRHSAEDLTCRMERWDYEAASSEFRCVDFQRLHLDRELASQTV